MSKTILVIDDDQVNQRLMETNLAKAGYDVDQAFDGQQGLTKIQFSRPDLIILDVEMPNANGYSFMMDLSKNEEWKTIPVIVLTSDEASQPIFERKGIKDYLLKPVDFSDLLEKINDYL